MMSKILSKLLNLRSKWLIMLLIGLLLIVIITLGYVKLYNIDSHNEQIDQLYNENKSLKTQLLKVENGCKQLNNSVSTLQTQMTYGVILDSAPKGKLQIKSNHEGESNLSSRDTDIPKPISKNHSHLKVEPKPILKDQIQLQSDLEEKKKFNASVEAQIEKDIEQMLNEDKNTFAVDTINQPLRHGDSAVDLIDPDDTDENDNQMIVVEDESENSQSMQENKLNIIRGNNFDINSSVLDLNNFREEMRDADAQLNHQLSHPSSQIYETDDDDIEDTQEQMNKNELEEVHLSPKNQSEIKSQNQHPNEHDEDDIETKVNKLKSCVNTQKKKIVLKSKNN